MALAGPVDAPAAVPAQLSTDYLNLYGEALMLMEMAPADPSVLDELKGWRAIGYRAHFEGSRLRCAGPALAGYAALDAKRRDAFETLCASMNRLILTATALLAELPQDQDLAPIVDVAAEALRKQISRATQFINANGAIDLDTIGRSIGQAEIDALFA